MAPGTRTPNARKLPDDYAGLPRDLNTELATETVAKLGAVFCLTATPKITAKHPNKSTGVRHLTLLFSGDLFEEKRRKGRPVEARQGRNELE